MINLLANETTIAFFCAVSLFSVFQFSACSGDGSKSDIDSGSDNDGGTSEDAGNGNAFEIDGSRIYADVACLSDEALNGRLPATQGNDTAVQYVASKFEEIGLDPGGDDGTFFQYFDYPSWNELAVPSLIVGGDELVEGVDFDFKRYSPSSTGSGELIFVGYGVRVQPFAVENYPDCPFSPDGYDDFQDVDIQGNLLVRFKGAPLGDAEIGSKCPFESVDDYLAGSSILGLMEVPDYLSGTAPGFIAGYYLDAMADNAYPGLIGNRDYFGEIIPDLSDRFERIADDRVPASINTGLSVQIDLEVETTQEVVANVIGVVNGNDPYLREEIVIVSAHVDHVGFESGSGVVYQGADDNASGTAAVIELARAAAALPGGSARTLVFVAWNAEETGMLGSCYYVDNPVYPIEDTVAVVNFDMVGTGTESGVLLLNGQESQNEWLVELMQAASLNNEVAYTIYPYGKLNQSDHVCFFERGVPAYTILSLGDHAEVHTLLDTIEIITEKNLEITTLLAWGVVESLASGSETDYVQLP